MNIKFISAEPGAGKTRALVQYVQKMFKTRKKVLFAVPTLKLIDEIHQLLPGSTRVCSATSKYVTSEIKKALTESVPGDVVLITHKSLFSMDINMLKLCEGFDLIVDEAFDVIKEYSTYKLRNSLRQEGLFSNFLQFDCAFSDKVLELRLDSVGSRNLAPLLKATDSPTLLDLTTTQNFIRAVKDTRTCTYLAKLKEKDAYAIIHTINPQLFDRFSSVLLSSAFFEHTATYCFLQRFHDLEDITDSLKLRDVRVRYSKMRIWPIIDKDYGYVYSKNIRKNFEVREILGEHKLPYTEDETYVEFDIAKSLTFTQYFEQVVEENFCSKGNDCILRVSNNDDYISFGERISPKSHGVNKYSTYSIIALLLALNPHTEEVEVYQTLMPEYDLSTDRLLLTLAQNISRTSIRDITCKDWVDVIVPDLTTAKLLKDIYQGLPKIKYHAGFDTHMLVNNVWLKHVSRDVPRPASKRISKLYHVHKNSIYPSGIATQSVKPFSKSKVIIKKEAAVRQPRFVVASRKIVLCDPRFDWITGAEIPEEYRGKSPEEISAMKKKAHAQRKNAKARAKNANTRAENEVVRKQKVQDKFERLAELQAKDAERRAAKQRA